MVNKSADAFRTISEVAEWLGVQTHVLRFWESKFSQVKPVKRAGGRRYYRPADMLLLGGIRKLLHEDGMTIKGVQKILREEGMAHVADMSPPLDEVTAAQVDGDLVAGDGAVEAEMAPAVEDVAETDVVVELTRQEPEPEPEPEAIPEPEEVAASTEPEVAAPETEAAPEPEPEAVTEPVHDAEPDAPSDPEPDAVGEMPAAPQTDDLFAAAPEDAPMLDAAQADDSSAEPEPEATAAPAPVEEEAPTLPSFMRSPDPAAAEPPADPAPEAEDAPAPDTLEASEPAGLPSFMTPPDVTAEPEPEPEPEPAPRKPRVVDVPDAPDPATLAATPSALGLAGRANALTPAQRAAIAPLVAELTALRDRMASARSDSR